MQPTPPTPYELGPQAILIATTSSLQQQRQPQRPPQMAPPTKHQLRGNPRENLIELAGRNCYDSLGVEKSRPTLAYHQHLQESGHTSVHEHVHLTMEIRVSATTTQEQAGAILTAYSQLINLPDLYIGTGTGTGTGTGMGPMPMPLTSFVRFTFNLRHIHDYLIKRHNPMGSRIWDLAALYAKEMVPMALPDIPYPLTPSPPWIQSAQLVQANPMDPNENFATFYIRSSRVLSHELVRHRNNISQRSSRFCDEAQSPYVQHPLHTRTMQNMPDGERAALEAELNEVKAAASDLYNRLTRLYIDMAPLTLSGPGQTPTPTPMDIRKQARSAARHYLPHGLETSTIYTASLTRWRILLAQRLSPAADEEIRCAAQQIQVALEKEGLL